MGQKLLLYQQKLQTVSEATELIMQQNWIHQHINNLLQSKLVLRANCLSDLGTWPKDLLADMVNHILTGSNFLVIG